MPSTSTRKGSCLCGAVKFEVSIPETTFNICHCGMCRKWCSGPFMGVHCESAATFSDDKELAWFKSSDWAERGFCKRCGTNLFYRCTDPAYASWEVSLAALEDPAGLTLDRHIFIDAKPDSYDFKDDRPRITEAALLKELGITPPG